ncbi:ROK family transcriptional regulator [Duganella sp. Dugasp56]|uniref:ROK family transcriptional regulator n=1 Tax=Duganella sp. Dugasp56 TaxID=3243046 RepID=UPI0039B06075
MKIARLKLSSEEKRLLWQLRTKGPLPRTELSMALQVSNSALTKLSRNLISMGLVEEQASSDTSGRGRPTVPLTISAAGGFAVGATVHKGVLEIALVDYAGGIIALTSEAVGAPDPLGFAQLLEQRITELSAKHRLLGGRFLGVGVGLPGPPRGRDGGQWNIVNDLPGWRNVPLRQILDNALGLPTMLENDANASALAEYYLNDTIRRSSTVVVFLLGYGIGAGVIEDGRLLKGEFGSAGDIGGLYPMDRPRPTTMDLLSVLREAGCPIQSIAHFDEASVGHEALIERWLDRAAGQLESVVNSAISWFDPGEIIFSSPLPESIMVRLAARLNRGQLRWPEHRQATEIRVSRLGGSSIALGAALLPIHASTTVSFW